MTSRYNAQQRHHAQRHLRQSAQPTKLSVSEDLVTAVMTALDALWSQEMCPPTRRALAEWLTPRRGPTSTSAVSNALAWAAQHDLLRVSHSGPDAQPAYLPWWVYAALKRSKHRVCTCNGCTPDCDGTACGCAYHAALHNVIRACTEKEPSND